MMKKILLFIAFVIPLQLLSQAKFIFEGNITYERRINNHRQFDDVEFFSEAYKDFLKSVPNFHVSNFTLQFHNNQTIYKPGGPMPQYATNWFLGPSKENIVYSNYDKQSRTSIKTVYESTFVINDSIHPVKWRISGEKRTIAGIECSKAVTIICDSVYVVAFYSDEIPVTGGPESFSGLPGMILGLAIPRLHTTWFATKVQLTMPTASDFEFPKKGQKTNNKKLMSDLDASIKNWGKQGERNIWWVML